MRYSLFNRIAFAPEGSESGGDEKPAARQTFSAEYVRELREEAKLLRHKLRETEAIAEEVKVLKEQVSKADKLREQAVSEALKSAKAEANQKLLNAELKTAATKAGLIDLDGIKLLDTSKVSISEDGVVSIPETFFEEAKTAKPYLFKAQTGAETGTTTNPTPAPKATNTSKTALEMSDEEFAQALKALG